LGEFRGRLSTARLFETHVIPLSGRARKRDLALRKTASTAFQAAIALRIQNCRSKFADLHPGWSDKRFFRESWAPGEPKEESGFLDAPAILQAPGR
jgi:hypothetical protein